MWGNRQHHVGDGGHCGLTHLEADDEGLGQRGGDLRQREVGRVDTTDNQRSEGTAGGGSNDPSGVATRGTRQGVDLPHRGNLGTGNGVGHRAPTGKQGTERTGLKGTALTGATRDPGCLLYTSRCV